MGVRNWCRHISYSHRDLSQWGRVKNGHVCGIVQVLMLISFVQCTRALNQTKITLPNGSTHDHFGASVSQSSTSDVLFVGAYTRQDGGVEHGNVHVFARNSTWGYSLAQSIVPADANSEQHFGYASSMSLPGTFAVIGARADDNKGSGAGAAYVYARDGSMWVQLSKLVAGDGDSGDALGWSVQLSANATIAIVGAPLADVNGSDSGALYVFVASASRSLWTEHQRLYPAVSHPGDHFGASAALSDDANVMLVGAPQDDSRGSDAGAVYWFYRNASTTGQWLQGQKVFATDASTEHFFGRAVALSADGTVAVVGAPGHSRASSIVGKVYIVVFKNGKWIQEAALQSPMSSPGDAFGCSSALSADGRLVLVGAHAADANGTDSGAAYVFQRNSTQPILLEQLFPSDAHSGADFGWHVSLSRNGTTAVVGSVYHNTSTPSAGAAFVFQGICAEGEFWDGARCQLCDCAAVGTRSKSSVCQRSTGQCACNSNFAGRSCSRCAEGYESAAGGQCVRHAVDLPVPGGSAAGDRYGFAVTLALNGTLAAVGAQQRDGSKINMGAVYVFRHSGTAWVHEASLTASDADDNDYFGWDVALSADGTTLAVAAHGDDVADRDSGSVYVFSYSGSSWEQRSKLAPADGADSDQFGESVALSSDGGVIAIGAMLDDDAAVDAGSVYVYWRTASGTSWVQQAKIVNTGIVANGLFGNAVALSGDGRTLLVGAFYDDALGQYSGSAAVYRNASGSWTNVANLTALDGASSDHFGGSVALSADGNTAVIGAAGDDDGFEKSGSLYIFANSEGNSWQQIAKLHASDAQTDGVLGSSCAVNSNGTVVVAGSRWASTQGTRAGNAYVFARLANNSWVERERLLDPAAAAQNQFGFDVAVSGSGNIVLVGAPLADSPGSDAGRALAFALCGSGSFALAGSCQPCNCVDIGIKSASASCNMTSGQCQCLEGYTGRTCSERTICPASAPLAPTSATPTSSCIPLAPLPKVTASIPQAQAYFGNALAADANFTRLVVGAPTSKNAGGIDTGSVESFRWNGSQWQSEETLWPSDGAKGDNFGTSVDLSEDGGTLVVGAWGSDDTADRAGSAYVFVHNGSAWQQRAKLLAPDGAGSDFFGMAVAISGDGSVILVGARDDDDHGDKSGSAYIYVANCTEWGMQQKIVPQDSNAAQRFGDYVSLSRNGSMAVVSQTHSTAGAVYTFERNSSGWFQTSKIVASDGVTDDHFGASLALSRDGLVLAVGAEFDDDAGTNSGSAYIYSRVGDSWTLRSHLVPVDGTAGDRFGKGIALSADGRRLAISSFVSSPSGPESFRAGSLYVYTEQEAGWMFDAKLIAEDGAQDDHLGLALALSANGSVLLASAYQDGIGALEQAGSVYTYSCRKSSVHFVATNGTDSPSCGTSLLTACRSLNYTLTWRGVVRGDTVQLYQHGANPFTCDDGPDGTHIDRALILEGASATGRAEFACADSSRALFIRNVSLAAGEVVLRHLAFRDGRSSTDGGAVLAYDVARLRVENCTFTLNRAGRRGGALGVVYSAVGGSNTVLAVRSCVFEGNQAHTQSNAVNGGGLAVVYEGAVVGATTELSNITAHNNSAIVVHPHCGGCPAYGGAISIFYAGLARECDISLSNLTLVDSQVYSHDSHAYGGGLSIFHQSDAISVRVTTHGTLNVSGNNAASMHGSVWGGGIGVYYFYAASMVDIIMSSVGVFRRNSADPQTWVAYGGGLSVYYRTQATRSTVVVGEATQFSDNFARTAGASAAYGGAIGVHYQYLCTDSTFRVTGESDFTYNTVTSAGGMVMGGAISVMHISTISNCTSSFHGQTRLQHNGVTVPSSFASGGGIGVFLQGTTSQYILEIGGNVTAENNSVSSAGLAAGGGVSVRCEGAATNTSLKITGFLNLRQNSISGGSTFRYGGGLACFFLAASSRSGLVANKRVTSVGNTVGASSTDGDGGGISVIFIGHASSPFLIFHSGCHIANNLVSAENGVSQGGGVAVSFYGIASHARVIFSGEDSFCGNNTAMCRTGQAQGGALFFFAGSRIEDSEFTVTGFYDISNNVANVTSSGKNALGGGMMVLFSQESVRTNITLGGMHRLIANEVHSLDQLAFGGALYIEVNASVSQTNVQLQNSTLFEKNRAISRSGSAQGAGLMLSLRDSTDFTVDADGTFVFRQNSIEGGESSTFTRGAGLAAYCKRCKRPVVSFSGHLQVDSNDVLALSRSGGTDAGVVGSGFNIELDECYGAELSFGGNATFSKNRGEAPNHRIYGAAMTVLVISSNHSSLNLRPEAMTFHGNSGRSNANLASAAGLYVQLSSGSANTSISIENALFTNNSLYASQGARGGSLSIFADDASNVSIVLRNSSFEDSRVTGPGSDGGALSIIGPEDTAITGSARRQWKWESRVTVDNCSFRNSYAQGLGGCARFLHGSVLLRNTTFHSCSAALGGGCIGLERSASITARNLKMERCSSESPSAGTFLQHQGNGYISFPHLVVRDPSHQGHIVRAPFATSMSWGGAETLFECTAGQVLRNRTGATFSAYEPLWTKQKFDCCQTTPVDLECVTCPSGSYTLSAGSSSLNATCRPCPYGASCPGGTSVRAQPGFWGTRSSTSDSVTMYSCPDGYCCSSSTSCSSFSVCEGNREGILCGDCVPGHSQGFATAGCVKDEDCGNPLFLILSGIFAFLFAAYLVYFATIEKSDLLSGVFYFYQIVPLFFVSSASSSVWESSIAELFSLQVPGTSVRDPEDAFCPIRGLSPIDKVLLEYANPLLVLVFAWILTKTVVCFLDDHRSEKKRVGLLLTAMMVYESIVDTSATLVNCDYIEGESRLLVSASTTCLQDWQWVIIALLFVVAPLPLWMLLAQRRARAQDSQNSLHDGSIHTSIELGGEQESSHSTSEVTNKKSPVVEYLEDGFKDFAWWWESWMLLRRLVLVLVSVFVTNTVTRLLILAALTVGFALVQLAVQPYEKDKVNIFNNMLECFLVVIAGINVRLATHVNASVEEDGEIARVTDSLRVLQAVLITLPLLFVIQRSGRKLTLAMIEKGKRRRIAQISVTESAKSPRAMRSSHSMDKLPPGDRCRL